MLREKKPAVMTEVLAERALLSSVARRIMPGVQAKERSFMKLNGLLLLAPLALLLTASIVQGQQNAASKNGWQQTQNADSARDTSTPQFSLPGKFLTRPQKDPGSPPELQVVCKLRGSRGKFSTASVNAGAPLTIEYVEPPEIKAGTSYFPKISVQYRLDDGKQEKDQWAPGTEKTSASIPKAALEKMLRAHTVQIRVQEYRGGEINMQFEIPDSTQLEAACDLPVRKK